MRCFFITCLFLTVLTNLNAQTEKEIIILHTNDIHSRLTGFGPETEYTPLANDSDGTSGGFSRIATLIKEERSKKPGSVLVIDAGDFLMGTLFHALEERTGFQLNLMKRMGYDVTCIGNHEYDFGPGCLAKIISTSSSNGAIPCILAGNTIYDKGNTGDDELEDLFMHGVLKEKQILSVAGIRVGLFSVIGKDAVSVAPNAYPVSFGKPLPYARRMVKELQKDGCDIIICLSHSGVRKNEDGSWGGEDVELAGKVKGINLIISGHTHTMLDEPVIVNGVPVVQAGSNGNHVGRIALTVSGHRTELESYTMIPVDDKIPGDPEIEKLITAQKELLTVEMLKPYGLSYDDAVAESSVTLEDSEYNNEAKNNLGPLVADAIHYYINKYTESGTDMSMVSAGVIREKILPGKITVPDIFRVMSLGRGDDSIPGYPLAQISITGRELKNVLEVLLIASRSNHDYYCYYSGIDVEYDPDGGFLKKISRIRIDRNGKMIDVDFSRKNKSLYTVSANSYMLAFIGIIKKKTFGLARVIPKYSSGEPVTDFKRTIIDFDNTTPGIQEGKEWLALYEYLIQMKDENGNGLPDLDPAYSNPVSRFVVVR